MVSLADYAGREQAYVKHVFLERYLERLVFKTASKYHHIVYVDGFAGPWQSANEDFEDTSFGIALNALRRAKQAWNTASQQRDVRMTALLVEQHAKAYVQLATIRLKYPDISIKTYNDDFMKVVPEIARDIPSDAFAFFLIDPKGWDIPLLKLKPLLAREKSEVIFNFMFEFINRAASMNDPDTLAGLDGLMPGSDWRNKMRDAEKEMGGPVNPKKRKEILVSSFKKSLRLVGGYDFVAETEVLRPLKDRTLYCLFYATRHGAGIEVFRDCQIAALNEQAKTRAAGKVTAKASTTGQSEMFASLHDMGPDETVAFLAGEKRDAEQAIKNLTPEEPTHIRYGQLWPAVLSQHVIRLPDVNAICAALRKQDKLLFLDWENRARVPKDQYRVQRPKEKPPPP
jgi:three-Cys-motif partner protein